MFYCDPCADIKSWPKPIGLSSYGRCETCGKTAECNDVPSSMLPRTKPARTDPPLRVWLYRGWCWICRECHPEPGSLRFGDRHRKVPAGVGSGHGFATQPEALTDALNHCHEGAAAEWAADHE